MIPNHEDFQRELDRILAYAQRQRRTYIDIRAGDLHRQVGCYPGSNHRMPLCCHVMKRTMRAGDRILKTPPSGFGANLVIRYRLPR